MRLVICTLKTLELTLLSEEISGICVRHWPGSLILCFMTPSNWPRNNFFFLILRSWDHASLMYSSISNKMQCYTMVFITINALHVSGGSSTHHQELKTVYTASGICQAFSPSYRYRE